jgi:hypothetical protein
MEFCGFLVWERVSQWFIFGGKQVKRTVGKMSDGSGIFLQTYQTNILILIRQQ